MCRPPGNQQVAVSVLPVDYFVAPKVGRCALPRCVGVPASPSGSRACAPRLRGVAAMRLRSLTPSAASLPARSACLRGGRHSFFSSSSSSEVVASACAPSVKGRGGPRVLGFACRPCRGLAFCPVGRRVRAGGVAFRVARRCAALLRGADSPPGAVAQRGHAFLGSLRLVGPRSLYVLFIFIAELMDNCVQ